MKPASTVDGLCGSFGIGPITPHNGVALAAEFAFFANRHNVTLFIDDFYFLMGAALTHGEHALLEGRIDAGHVIDWAGLSLPITDDHFRHVHLLDRPLH